MGLFIILCGGIYLKHCIVDTSHESGLGTIGNTEHAKDFFFYFIKV